MEDFDFTEDEIKEQLDILGYKHVPSGRLQEFKRDLELLVKHERSKNSSLFSTSEQSSSSDSEAHRIRYHQTNGMARTPLDDVNYKQLNSGQTSNIPVDPSRDGKENVYIAPSTLSGEPSYHRQQDRRDESPTDRVLSYAAYRSQPRVPIGPDLVTDETDEQDTTLDTSTSTEKRMIRRKVLRKRDGHTEIYETESETGDLDSLQERLRNIGLSVHMARPSTAPPGHRHRPASSRCSSQQSMEESPCYRLPEDYDGLKALIRPMSKEPNQKNIKKTDPVSRYQDYRSSWQCHRTPGEKARKNLRWGIREQMLYHDQVVNKKQPKVYVPNGYTVPSDKKRKDLRWQIRHDLAQGVVPPSMYD